MDTLIGQDGLGYTWVVFKQRTLKLNTADAVLNMPCICVPTM